MRIFISHSWKDKTFAQKVADSLNTTTDIWLDLTQLFPGQHIQNTIDVAIKQMDFIILLWSKDSAASGNVSKEVTSAKRAGVDILPCLLDETPVDSNTDLRGLLGIDCVDRKVGLFRIHLAIMHKWCKVLGGAETAALNDVKSYEGALNYVNDYYNRHGMSGEGSLDWVLKLLETGNQSFQSVSKMRDHVGGGLQFIQSIMARVEEAGNDRAKLQSILNELIRSQYKDIKGFEVLISFVEGRISALPPDEQEQVEEKDKDEDDAVDFDTMICLLAAKIAEASREPLEQLRHKLTPFFPPQVLSQSIEALNYYLVCSPASLRQFAAAVLSSPSDSLKQIARELFNYLISQDDIIPDDANGLLGYLDDAWLIHNTSYRCIEAGLLNTQHFSVDWNKIVAADQIALNLFPPNVKGMLDRLITQYMLMIAEEVQQYEPSFNPDSSGQGYHTYDAYMGVGSAVGGSPLQNAETIDDICYTIGDKMYLIR